MVFCLISGRCKASSPLACHALQSGAGRPSILNPKPQGRGMQVADIVDADEMWIGANKNSQPGDGWGAGEPSDEAIPRAQAFLCWLMRRCAPLACELLETTIAVRDALHSAALGS